MRQKTAQLDVTCDSLHRAADPQVKVDGKLLKMPVVLAPD